MGERQVRGSSRTLNKCCLVSKNKPHAATDSYAEADLALSATLTLQCNCCKPSRTSYGPQPSSTFEASASSRCVYWNVAKLSAADTSLQTRQVAVSLARRPGSQSSATLCMVTSPTYVLRSPCLYHLSRVCLTA
jgi:hypothetical protein